MLFRGLMITAAVALSGCYDASDEKYAVALSKFSNLCQNFEYISPEWAEAASNLRKKIQSGQIDPYLEVSIKSEISDAERGQSVLVIPNDAGHVTVDFYDIYERGQFRFKMKMPVYYRNNGNFTLSAPRFTPIECTSIDRGHLHKYF